MTHSDDLQCATPLGLPGIQISVSSSGICAGDAMKVQNPAPAER